MKKIDSRDPIFFHPQSSEARGTPRDHPTGRAGRVDDVSTASAVGLGRGAGADVWCRGTLQALA